ncbi:MAG: hypothetical protein P4L87_19900 [Formivibrio sp.]|nr:hypothetical protein [Formivibrio sp.]
MMGHATFATNTAQLSANLELCKQSVANKMVLMFACILFSFSFHISAAQLDNSPG